MSFGRRRRNIITDSVLRITADKKAGAVYKIRAPGKIALFSDFVKQTSGTDGFAHLR